MNVRYSLSSRNCTVVTRKRTRKGVSPCASVMRNEHPAHNRPTRALSSKSIVAREGGVADGVTPAAESVRSSAENQGYVQRQVVQCSGYASKALMETCSRWG